MLWSCLHNMFTNHQRPVDFSYDPPNEPNNVLSQLVFIHYVRITIWKTARVGYIIHWHSTSCHDCNMEEKVQSFVMIGTWTSWKRRDQNVLSHVPSPQISDVTGQSPEFAVGNPASLSAVGQAIYVLPMSLSLRIVYTFFCGKVHNCFLIWNTLGLPSELHVPILSLLWVR